MNRSFFIISEKIYESDNDLLYDLSKPIKNNVTWRNNIVFKYVEENTTMYLLIKEDENIVTRSISSSFYKSFHEREDALKEALADAMDYNLK